MYLPVFQRVHVPAEGSEIWVAAENAYNERVARVENQIIARLRDRLGTARNANEMFRVFSKFNALFVRPKVCFLKFHELQGPSEL